jgi:hypothetical protein
MMHGCVTGRCAALAGYLFFKSVESANKAAERADRADGY